MLLAALLAIPCSYLPGFAGDAATAVAVFAGFVLIVLLPVLLFRWTTRRAMWKVRRRLIATCLLMGLAPVVLFGTLTALAAYVLMGQYATNTAMAALDGNLGQVKDASAALLGLVGHALEHRHGVRTVALPEPFESSIAALRRQGLTLEAWQDGAPLRVGGAPLPAGAQPAWLHAALPGVVFTGIAADGGRLYLRAVTGFGPQGHTVMALASLPLSDTRLTSLAQGLGELRLIAHANAGGDPDPDSDASGSKPAASPFRALHGGALPPSTHLLDAPIFFALPLHLTDWTTGNGIAAQMFVVSRPGLLYRELFANSVEVGVVARNILLGIALAFFCIEALALFMAVRLSRTITRSVAHLYGATREIERGHLGHRIPVKGNDQLAALETSFNTMAGSLEALVEHQRERERLQREIEIAQQVQNTLFPSGPMRVAGFEMHGVCKPARTVGGDYYDFLLSGNGQIYLAVGDISGKGISAALLMASLHSAVRAYGFAHGGGGAERDGFPPPSKLLALLNRHLYASTAPEKYATLFLACYDTGARRLTYANAGQLPPLLFHANGSVERLDRGGPVWGSSTASAMRKEPSRWNRGRCWPLTPTA